MIVLIWFIDHSIRSAWAAIILVLKVRYGLERLWNWTIHWLHWSKCDYIQMILFIDTIISFWGNNISPEGVAAIKRSLNFWTRRKNLLIFIFISLFSRSRSPDEGNHCYLNVKNVTRVLEMEEMKREISNFLWWVNFFLFLS